MDFFALGPGYIGDGNRDQSSLSEVPCGDSTSSAGNCGRVANSREDFGAMYGIRESFKPGSSSRDSRNLAREMTGFNPGPHEMRNAPTFEAMSNRNNQSEKTLRSSLCRGDVHELDSFSQETPKFDKFAQELLKRNPVARDMPKLNARSGDSIWASAEEPLKYDIFSRGAFNNSTRNEESLMLNTFVRDTPMPGTTQVNMPSYSSLSGNTFHTNGNVKKVARCDSVSQNLMKLNVIAHEMRKLNAIANDMLKFNTLIAQTQSMAYTSDAFCEEMPNFTILQREMCKFNKAAEEILRFKAETQQMTDFNIAALLDPVYEPETEEKPELPTCLNPLCGKKHLISHCDITGPDEARVLTNAFFAKEKAGQKKKRTRSRRSKKPNNS